MKVISNIDNYHATSACSLTIGTFDGVHVGHREIIQRLVNSAKEKNLLSVVLTFFPHPRIVLQKDTSIKLIDTLAEKQQLLENLGVDVLIVHPFSKAFSRQSADEFIRDILVNTLQIGHLIIGYDHRFGRNREATVDALISAGETYGFSVDKIEAQDIDSVNVSSTKIRTALQSGDITTANTYLGRNYCVSGRVIHGNQLGRSIGYPTANIEVKENYKLIPADGVYAVKVCNKYTKFDGMLNIGQKPTIGGENKTIEVNIFDFNQDIYNTEITIEFVDHVRNEIKFDSLDSLKLQLAEDEKAVRNRLSKL